MNTTCNGLYEFYGVARYGVSVLSGVQRSRRAARAIPSAAPPCRVEWLLRGPRPSDPAAAAAWRADFRTGKLGVCAVS